MAAVVEERLIRVDSVRVVEVIAAANGVDFARTSHTATATVDGVTYFWTAL